MENQTVAPDAPHPAAPSAPPAPAPAAKQQGLTPEQVATIKARLLELGVAGQCPRCGNPDFTVIAEGVVSPAVQKDLNASAPIGAAPTIPSLVTFCNKCGFLSLHALGVLGFLKNGQITI